MERKRQPAFGRFAPWIILMLGLAPLVAPVVGCGSEPSYQVLENGVEVRGYSAVELRNRILDGRLSETSLIFDGAEWKLFREVPVLAEFHVESAPVPPPFEIPLAPIVELAAQFPDQPLVIDSYLVPGKIMVFFFHSLESIPCQRFVPWLEKLGQGRSDILVRKVEIEQSGFGSVVWRAALEQPTSLPHFKIFNPRGQIVAEGERAQRIVIEWLKRRSGEGI